MRIWLSYAIPNRQDLAAAGGCIVDTVPGPNGAPRILTVHVPHRATHVIDLVTVGNLISLLPALQDARVAGFAPLLPAELGLAVHKIWDGQLAVEVLYQGQISKLPSLKEAGTAWVSIYQKQRQCQDSKRDEIRATIGAPSE